jgi:hypothetical protein
LGVIVGSESFPDEPGEFFIADQVLPAELAQTRSAGARRLLSAVGSRNVDRGPLITNGSAAGAKQKNAENAWRQPIHRTSS